MRGKLLQRLKRAQAFEFVAKLSEKNWAISWEGLLAANYKERNHRVAGWPRRAVILTSVELVLNYDRTGNERPHTARQRRT